MRRDRLKIHIPREHGKKYREAVPGGGLDRFTTGLTAAGASTSTTPATRPSASDNEPSSLEIPITMTDIAGSPDDQADQQVLGEADATCTESTVEDTSADDRDKQLEHQSSPTQSQSPTAFSLHADEVSFCLCHV